MPTLHLIRHGKAAGGFGEAADPGLDATGRAQAAAMTASIAPLGPLAMVSSPLLRARETAEPLTAAWQTAPAIEARVAEIPSPTPDLAARVVWLRALMEKRWSDADATVAAWRQAILDCLGAITEDSAIVTHFMVINAAVGAAMGDDRLVIFRPDNCSRTVIETTEGGLRLIALGGEAETQVG